VALTTIFERALAYYRENKRRSAAARVMLKDLSDHNTQAAIARGEKSLDLSARCLTAALQAHESSFAAAYQHAAARELRRLSRGLPTLDTVITIAPLMGLLGTVTGMIRAFGLMGGSELQAPTAITGGVAEALIATAFGLGIAICSLIPFNWLHAQVEKAQHELQDVGSQAELLLARRPFVERRRFVRTEADAERYQAALPR
jgi:biopolymer transport protein ExbB